MLVMALTGGIASGKSVVAARLDELGAVVIDSDVLAREVVAPGTPGLARVAEEFGPDVIARDGSLDRAALGAIVFADPARRAALEAITHPLIQQRASALVAEAAGDAVVVRDIPLLVETVGRHPSFDLVVVVHAELETRISRLMEHRGMTREEAIRRIEAQASEAERLAIADIVIDNDDGLEHTMRQVDELWTRLSADVRERAH